VVIYGTLEAYIVSKRLGGTSVTLVIPSYVAVRYINTKYKIHMGRIWRDLCFTHSSVHHGVKEGSK
jgi:hypothetical protein